MNENVIKNWDELSFKQKEHLALNVTTMLTNDPGKIVDLSNLKPVMEYLILIAPECVMYYPEGKETPLTITEESKKELITLIEKLKK